MCEVLLQIVWWYLQNVHCRIWQQVVRPQVQVQVLQTSTRIQLEQKYKYQVVHGCQLRLWRQRHLYGLLLHSICGQTRACRGVTTAHADPAIQQRPRMWVGSNELPLKCQYQNSLSVSSCETVYSLAAGIFVWLSRVPLVPSYQCRGPCTLENIFCSSGHFLLHQCPSLLPDKGISELIKVKKKEVETRALTSFSGFYQGTL